MDAMEIKSLLKQFQGIATYNYLCTTYCRNQCIGCISKAKEWSEAIQRTPHQIYQLPQIILPSAALNV